MCESCSRPPRRSGRSSEKTRRANWAKRYDTSGLRYLFLAGERCDVATLQWAQQVLKVPVIDHWWQTESGWPMVANSVGIEKLPIKPGSATKPVCGYDLRVLDAAGREVPRGPGRVDRDSFAVAARLPDESVAKPGAFPATPISATIPAIIILAMVAIRTTKVTSLSRAASTTSLTWRAIGFPRPQWRRSSLHIRLWRSAP